MKRLATALSCLLFVACAQSGESAGDFERSDAGGTQCDDRDGDGFGEGCSPGGDCDDFDKSIHTGCTRCQYPQEGCGCAATDKPVSCYLTPSEADEGTIMCHEGTRYCRGGLWSACEAVVTYPRTEAVDQAAIISPTGTPSRCSDCEVNCFVVRDNLDPTDAGLGGSSTNVTSSGGGLTLVRTLQDAGTPDTGPVIVPSKCVLGAAPDKDCDGILDKYDPYPEQKPFATANPAIFMDIAPGETGTGAVDLTFNLNSVDVYFLLDQSSTMADERDRLKQELVSGDFIQSSTYECADYDFDLKPNNELKTQGLMGAIRCMMREANFGVGFFREIPFAGYGANDSVTFRNVQDITSDISQVSTAISSLTTLANSDRPEAGSLALNALVTGNGFDFGAGRLGVPARTDCPSGGFGAPCFRSKSIPIVLMFTDDPTHQGPAGYEYNYGTLTKVQTLATSSESYTSATELGDVASATYTYTGTTSGMGADVSGIPTSCLSITNSSPDAVVKFTVAGTTSKTVAAKTTGADFDTALLILKAAPTNSTAVAATGNDVATNAYAFGDVRYKNVQVSGNSSTLSSNYSTYDVSCDSAGSAKDAAFTFKLVKGSGTRHLILDASGSSYGTTLALFNKTPVLTTYTPINNTNATQSMGTVSTSKNVGYSSDTSSGVTVKHIASQLTCADAPADDAFDADYSFVLSAATHVRISTEGSDIDNVIALTKNPTVPTVPVSGGKNTNELQSSAVNLGVLDNATFRATASTASMAGDYQPSVTTCDTGTTSTPDAAFKFTLNSQRTVTLDTTGSSFDTVLSLFRGSITTVSKPASAHTNEVRSSALDLGTVSSGAAVTTGAATSWLSGSTTVKMGATYTAAITGSSGCTPSGTSPDAVYKFHLDTTTNVRIETTAATFDTLIALYSSAGSDLSTSSWRACNDNSGTPNLARIDADNLAAGDYYVLVRGTSNTAFGSYTLSVRDRSTSWGFVTCNDNYSTRQTSSITETLTAGTYYAVVRGSSAATPTSGSYVLSVQDMSTNIACDHGSGVNGSSLIDADLTAGTYRVIVKGKEATDNGKYKLAVRDTTNTATNRVMCAADGGTAGAARIETDLTASTTADTTYTVLLKGDTTSGAGNYKLTLRDATPVTVASDAVTCNDDASTSVNTSSISTSLAPGSYYLVVRGHDNNDKGAFTVSLGVSGTPPAAPFVPPTWAETIDELKKRNVRVIPVVSCLQDGSDKDSYCAPTRAQYTALATSTGALGSNDEILEYDIEDDGSGLSTTVVQGVSQLAHYLEMDVSAQVVFEPDANPGFIYEVKAIDAPGDGCSGMANNEHQNCLPGATPKFTVLFTNPKSAPVPLNDETKDPNGGYNFRVELIGDNKFVVDQVPLYIMPINVTSTNVPEPQVASSGTYSQDLSASSCTGNLLPDWRDLKWDSTIPNGTSVSFRVCTSDSALTGCIATPLCTITGGAACTDSSTCGDGFCSTTDHNCQTIKGKSCTKDADCTTGATCKSARCTFSGQPVYIGEALGNGNYTTNLRMFIDLTGNTVANTAPTVHDWSLSYVCNSAQ